MGKVVVAGSINMDVVATSDRHPGIGETVAGRQAFLLPGGKGANEAVAAAKLGAETVLIGAVGADAFGDEVLRFLATHPIDLTHVRQVTEVATGIALIMIADAKNTIVVVPGANAVVSCADATNFKLERGDVVVSQFEISLDTIWAFFSRARDVGATTILNPAPAIEFDRRLLDLIDVLILNESELESISGISIASGEDDVGIVMALRSVRRDAEQVVCVTLGPRGALVLAGEGHWAVAGHHVNAVDSTGAGDCFVGAVAARLAANASIREAFEYANVAASICVERMGAGPSMPTAAEVENRLRLIRR